MADPSCIPTPAGSDPWAEFQHLHAASCSYWNGTFGACRCGLQEAIARARAAVEAQHAHEIEQLQEQLDTYEGNAADVMARLRSAKQRAEAAEAEIAAPQARLEGANEKILYWMRRHDAAVQALRDRFSFLADCTPLDEQARLVFEARVDELRQALAVLTASDVSASGTGPPR